MKINIERAIAQIKDGKMVVVVDSPDRENEGDLVCAAQKATPEIINFMAKFGRGLICAPLKSERLEELKINDMLEFSKERKGCCFTVSVDYKFGTTTGISAFDRAMTVQKLIDEKSSADDFMRPGHIFPLRYRDGGVLARDGHTEAAVDLAVLAGLYPAAVICEIMNDDGTMMKTPDLIEFAKKHSLEMVTIEALIEYRKKNTVHVSEVERVKFPTEFGQFTLALFEDNFSGENCMAIIKGDIAGKEVLARIHSSCETGDVFHSLRCDCGKQLAAALKNIEAKGRGIVLYMHQEGRGIGLKNKIKAYRLQEQGMDTVEANIALGFAPDMRDYGIAAQVLKLLKIESLNLMTNNPSKISMLESYGIKIAKRIPIEAELHDANKFYMQTKKDKMGHLLESI